MAQILECIVGLQAGDEGKGRVVDDAVIRAQQQDDGKRVVTVRFQGGDNAGHSLYVPMPDGSLQKFVTHAAPSGLVSNADVAIGPNVAFDPLLFLKELKSAEELFNYNGRIMISERTGVKFDYHRKIDAWQESKRIDKIGTTKSGIGPFYVDNARRNTRITMADYVSDKFPDKLRNVLEFKKYELNHAHVLALNYMDDCFDELLEIHEPLRKQFKNYLERLEYRLADYLSDGNHIIIEGAQGKMIDVDMGTIPDTTSSHLLAPHAFPSLGLPRGQFKIVGVEKIYGTRVGSGKMVTDSEELESVISASGEWGATTGRRRRAGWPDWVNIKHGVILNDCDSIYLTRADCVQDVELKVCVGYHYNDKNVNEVPLNLNGVAPIFQDKTYNWKLWEGDRDLSDPELVDTLLKQRRMDYVEGGFESLPQPLQEFVIDHDKAVGVKTEAICIGPGRGEMIYR
ncbi:adenylosuccinate synthetase [Candidatus Woesearchaeota archaeon]|nr:adenylosuccinate synthetase [Candidatus Woesearchaeota archaeon]